MSKAPKSLTPWVRPQLFLNSQNRRRKTDAEFVARIRDRLASILLASLSPLTESNVTSYAIGRKGRSALPRGVTAPERSLIKNAMLTEMSLQRYFCFHIDHFCRIHPAFSNQWRSESQRFASTSILGERPRGQGYLGNPANRFQGSNRPRAAQQPGAPAGWRSGAILSRRALEGTCRTSAEHKRPPFRRRTDPEPGGAWLQQAFSPLSCTWH